ncbi:MAG: thiamine pyrophosphate-dependent enzyme [Actinomycetota bacterium]|nr:thiamine pyrophosphate-dependent enzyme [Actinomycetota bacterium]
MTIDANLLSSDIRRIVLEQSKRAHVGHIGSCLSVADLVASVFAAGIADADPDDPDRDRFVLSKGHAALALYAALHATGRVGDELLASFCSDGSSLGTHPEHVVDGVDFSTGSLGQGLSMAAGAALAARIQRSTRRVFVVMSDAECNEGSLWEAAMFAAHHRLSALVGIVDANGQQALGYTRDVIDLSPLAARWRAFGWDVHDVDGHDVDALTATIAELDTATGGPHVLIARTVFGSGVSFMEGQIPWHYWPMSDEQYERAMAEVTA